MRKIIYQLTVSFFMVVLCCSTVMADDKHVENKGSPVGSSADPSQAKKIVRVTTADDMQFHFTEQPVLHANDVVTFVVTNSGKVPHEFSIGDEAEQKAHQEMMRKMPNMIHEDDNTITVNPGETKEITWRFKGGSEVVFACNIPGHFEAGMLLKIRVK